MMVIRDAERAINDRCELGILSFNAGLIAEPVEIMACCMMMNPIRTFYEPIKIGNNGLCWRQRWDAACVYLRIL